MQMILMFRCLCVCLAGQTCRGSEEEQGNEGGSLPVDKWSEEAVEEEERERARLGVLWVVKKKKKKKIKTVQENKRTQTKRKEFSYWCMLEQAVQSLA